MRHRADGGRVVEGASEGRLPNSILTERVDDHLLVIRVDRPHRRNAFDGAMARTMEGILDEFDEDPDLRCAVLTGSDTVFCAGQDLFAAAQGDIARAPKRGGFGIAQVPPTKPVIAAVEGYALGGGLELCLACDLIVASRSAVMGLPEVRRSLVATGGGVVRLPRRIPYHLAMELALTGKGWPATRMAELGLVNRLTEPGKALDGALELANEILEAGPLAVRASKAIIRRTYDWVEDEAWKRQLEFAAPIMDSEDVKEGLQAFAEKRAPVWKGH